jgi:hypothetical protein
MADARSKATEKYRKANVKSFNVKFFPSDAEVLEYFQGKENRNQYIKDLIRKDMESTKSLKTYVFETANEGDVTITISGEYVGGCVDMEAGISGTGDYREWTEIDGGSVEEIFEWLMDKGVEFENDRSLWLNLNYVEQVMIDRSKTEDQLLDYAASMTDEELKKWREFYFDI